MIVVAAAMASTIFWCLERMVDRQHRNTASVLVSVLSSTQSGLKVWSRDLKGNASVWAERRDVRDAVRRQLLVPREPRALLASPAAEVLRLKNIVARNHFLGVDVIAPDGTDIASTFEGALGTQTLAQTDPHSFADALAGTVTLGLPFQQAGSGGMEGHGPALILAAPVRDDAGAVVAVLAFRLLRARLVAL
jgi:hypothetical protein